MKTSIHIARSRATLRKRLSTGFGLLLGATAMSIAVPLTALAQSGAPGSAGFSVWPWLITMAVVVTFIRLLSTSRRRYLRLPTLEQYLAAHPDCGKQPGRVLCHVCRSSNIYIRWMGVLFGGVETKTHLCRTCGTSLWRSG